ncbi:hypothetical protein [Ferrimonas lipolytica]|uniref:Uncharacterized protein n=1 Tax=Ferrimonas lipolytica TaxID=2724191 RepID=A0A6H1UFG3_9GAMM|nr:hypothetical protein [Ferrimonas lipolytica]QIZ77063.1 hypothetical protein HER31_09305 [Ferrimonas lipolytica]
MLDNMLTEQVQLGFDIATSVTIIGALLSWGWESRRRASKERQLGLHEQARVASLEKVQSIVSEFETAFSDLVQAAHQFQAPIRRRINVSSDNPFERLQQYITKNPESIDQFTERLAEIRLGVDGYYEAIQKRRYSLVPVLDSLPGGKEFLASLQKDIQEIGDAHDQINSGYVALLKEFHAAAQKCEQIISETEFENPDDVSDKEKIQCLLDSNAYRQAAYWLVSDKDYDSWTNGFIPTDAKQEFEQRREDKTLLENDDLLFNVYVNLASYIIKQPNASYAEILWLASKQVGQTTTECKDILIKLSALTHKLLVNNEDTELKKIIELYESDEYLGRETSIR